MTQTAVESPRSKVAISPSEVIVFRRGDESFAVAARLVQRVAELDVLTPFPHALPSLVGITHLEGEVFPLFDLRPFWELPHCGVRDLPYFLLLADQQAPMGIVAESVEILTGISESDLANSPPPPPQHQRPHISGRLEAGPLVLDVSGLLGDPAFFVGIS